MSLPVVPDNKENNIFGERLKCLRITMMKKTQLELCEILGITQPTLSAYESGRNKPTVEVLINISKKCHVSLDWLCGNDISADIGCFQSLEDVMKLLLDLSEEKGISCEISFRR